MSPLDAPKKPAQREKVVCRCLGVTESQLVDAIQTRSIETVEDVAYHTQAGDGCTACHPLIRRYLQKLGKSCEASERSCPQHGPARSGWAAA